MVQRIQTLYLLGAAIAAFGMAFLPFWQSMIGLMALPVLVGVLSLANIFLYKNRPFQLKVGKRTLWLVIFLILATLYVAIRTGQEQQLLEWWNLFGGALILVIMVLLMLANRAIARDEKLVRSMDRLR